MSILKPLVWHETKDSFIDGRMELSAQGAGIFYTMRQMQGHIQIDWHNQVKGSHDKNTSYRSFNEAQNFISNKHYPHFMSDFIKQDSTQRIENWFKAAKPEPTAKDALVQQGCHFEEVSEHLASIGMESDDLCDISNDLKSNTRLQTDDAISNYMSTIDNLELLDSLCDQIVTTIGVGYMMGFDIQGALNEVIRSNDSKMVNGKFIFDDNGKISKPSSYSEPDLTPFLGGRND